MKNKKKVIISSVIVALISLPTIIEGISVIRGSHITHQVVLLWLVYYNVVMAVISLLAIFLFWTKVTTGGRVAIIILFCHVMVLLVLVYIYISTGHVATKSIIAMSMRSAIWVVIIFLIHRQR
jgi:hypothetical protein